MKKFEAHILVVDDDDGIRDLVKKYLNENNYLVTTAASAEDAQKKVETIKFDLIVLDIMMPGKSGLEFTTDNKNKLYTPIILLTAKGEAEERVHGLEVGADDYLSKPFEPKELILRIKNILNKTKTKNIKRLVEFGNIKIDLRVYDTAGSANIAAQVAQNAADEGAKIILGPLFYEAAQAAGRALARRGGGLGRHPCRASL